MMSLIGCLTIVRWQSNKLLWRRLNYVQILFTNQNILVVHHGLSISPSKIPVVNGCLENILISDPIFIMCEFFFRKRYSNHYMFANKTYTVTAYLRRINARIVSPACSNLHLLHLWNASAQCTRWKNVGCFVTRICYWNNSNKSKPHERSI